MMEITDEQRIELIRRVLENRPFSKDDMITLLKRIVEGNLCYIVTLSKRAGYVEVFNASSADEAKNVVARRGFSADDAVFEADWPYAKGRRPVDRINL